MKSRNIVFLLIILLICIEKVEAETVFIEPLNNYYISSYYGTRIDPISFEKSFHGGIDLAAAGGTDLRAVFDGVVVTDGYDDGYGNYIEIQSTDGQYRAKYAHMQDYVVSEGQVVSSGDIVGHVGTTGRSTGNHLHFEVKKNDGNGNYPRINPDDVLNFINATNGSEFEDYDLHVYATKHQTGKIDLHIDGGASPYKVYKSFDMGAYVLLNTININIFTEYGLDNGQTVYYRVIDDYGTQANVRYTPYSLTYNVYPVQITEIHDDLVHVKWSIDFNNSSIYLDHQEVASDVTGTEYTITDLEPNSKHTLYLVNKYDEHSNTITFQTTDELTKIESILTKLFIPSNMDSNSDGMPDIIEPLQTATDEAINKLTDNVHNDVLDTINLLANDTTFDDSIGIKMETEWQGVKLVIMDLSNPMFKEIIAPIRAILVAILTVACILTIITLFDIQFKV